jgi:hypothetical protein
MAHVVPLLDGHAPSDHFPAGVGGSAAARLDRLLERQHELIGELRRTAETLRSRHRVYLLAREKDIVVELLSRVFATGTVVRRQQRELVDLLRASDRQSC